MHLPCCVIIQMFLPPPLSGSKHPQFSKVKFWYLNGKLHRENGAAIEYTDSYKEWYYKGKVIDCHSQEEFKHLLNLKAFW